MGERRPAIVREGGEMQVFQPGMRVDDAAGEFLDVVATVVSLRRGVCRIPVEECY